MLSHFFGKQMGLGDSPGLSYKSLGRFLHLSELQDAGLQNSSECEDKR